MCLFKTSEVGVEQSKLKLAAPKLEEAGNL